MLSWSTLTVGERIQATCLLLLLSVGLLTSILSSTSISERLIYASALLSTTAAILDPQFVRARSIRAITLRSMPKLCRTLVTVGGILGFAGIVGGWL